MQKQNRAALSLGDQLAYAHFAWLRQLGHGQHGVFLYSCPFLSSGALCLDNSRGIPLAFVTGLLSTNKLKLPSVFMPLPWRPFT